MSRPVHDPMADLIALNADAAVELDAATDAYLAAEDRVRAAIRSAAGSLSEREITRRCPYSRETVRKILADG